MLIAQLTDIHLGFERGNPDEPNLRRLKAVLARLAQGPNRPDLLLLTGDLTEHGDAPSYRVLAKAIADCPFPVWPMIGNHDDRQAFFEIFPDIPSQGGFAHYAIAGAGFRILALDTHEPGRHGGGFCAERAAWLRAELTAHPEVPTLIAMHHPPVVSGIAWMDPDPAEPWIARFAEAIAGQRQVRAIICGHVHRSIQTGWNSVPVMVCPSVAPAVALDLSPLDPAHADGRALIADEPPGLALHRWDGRNIVSHIEYVPGGNVLACFEPALAPMISAMMGERAV
jgi:3',5'-cyclic AMP phosphodiesterase CpdA